MKNTNSYPSVTFSTARRFWAFGEGTGLADFTNANFVSKDTNFQINNGTVSVGTRYSSPKPEPFDESTGQVPVKNLFAEINKSFPKQLEDICQDPATQQMDCYMDFYATQVDDLLFPDKNGTNERASSLSLFDQDLQYFGPVQYECENPDQHYVFCQVDRLFALNRFNFDAAHQFLIPRAVAYSAGLIDHFFRGRLEIAPPVEGDQASYFDTATMQGDAYTHIRLRMRNLTPPAGGAQQDMKGSLVVVARYSVPGETQERVSLTPPDTASQVEYILPAQLPGSQSWLEQTFAVWPPVPANAGDLRLSLVYKGLLGEEDAVVAATARFKNTPIIELFAGTGEYGYAGDGGPAVAAQFKELSAITVGPDSGVYISDYYNSRVRKIGTDGIIGTFAGDGRINSAGSSCWNQPGPATEQSLSGPRGIAVDTDGAVYFLDSYCIQKVYNETMGIWGAPPYYWASHMIIHDGVMYVADSEISRMTTNIKATKIVGDGKSYLPPYVPLPPYPGDGVAATSLPMFYVPYMAVRNGELYFSHMDYDRVFKVDGEGKIRTVAGTDTAGYSGDGGPAVNARLNNPTGIAFGPSGTLYIADTNNHRIRAVDKDGVIRTMAGTGVAGYSGDGGPAAQAQLNLPLDMATDPNTGDLYVLDLRNKRVRRVRYLE